MRPPLSSAQVHGQWASAELCGALARGVGRREFARFLCGWPSVTQVAAQASARTSLRHARPRHKPSDTLQTKQGQISTIHRTGGGGGDRRAPLAPPRGEGAATKGPASLPPVVPPSTYPSPVSFREARLALWSSVT